MTFWVELKRRNIYKVGTAYFLFSLAVLAIQSDVATALQLSADFQRWIVIFLAVGAVPVLLLAWVYELTPTGIRRTNDVDRNETYARKKDRQLNFVILALLVGALVGWGFTRFSVRDDIWLYETALPQLDEYLEAQQGVLALALADEIVRRVPGSEELAERLPLFTYLTSIDSDPPGARVSRRPYGAGEDEWEDIGVTPLTDLRMLRGPTVVKLERDGYETQIRVLGPMPFPAPRLQLQPYVMDRHGALPDGMVRVPGWTEPEDLGGEPVAFDDYFLGKNEVSNREFQEFVDDDGYQNPDWWPASIIVNDQEISFGTDEWFALFSDSSGRIGPSTWEGGRFRSSLAEHPVTGVSWYEASAYAAWAGRELPSFVHWRRANPLGQRPWVVPASNVQSSGLQPVDTCRCYSFPGALDMAGNAREWLQSPEMDGQHLAMGGSWREETWRANFPQLVSSLDRKDINGIRLADTADPEPTMAKAYAWTPPRLSFDVRDLREDAPPVGDEEFAGFVRDMGYDPQELNTEIEETHEFDDWVRQRIVIDAAYDGFRLPVYLFLPKNAEPPFKTVVMFPAGNFWGMAEFDDFNLGFMDYVVQNGFAVALPVYPGSFERKDENSLVYPRADQSATYAAQDWIIKAQKDVRRTVDLLVSMEDTIYGEKIGYLGVSAGGEFASIVLALEERLTAAAILLGGLDKASRFLPQVDPWNYVPRVCQDVLFVAAETDNIHPLETSGQPWFDTLCTAEEDREPENEIFVSFGGHWLPRNEYVGRVPNFFDKHLGPPIRL